MFGWFRHVLPAFLLGAASVANGQQFDPGDPAFDSTIRAKYEKTTALPDSIAFLETMRTLTLLSDPAGVIQTAMGLDRPSSEEFLQLLLTTFGTVNAEIAAAETEMGCQSRVPRVYGDDVYELFENMDDMTENVARKHYESVRSAIDGKTAAKLHQWLQMQKPNITYVKFNHKEAYQRANEDASARLAELCNRR